MALRYFSQISNNILRGFGWIFQSFHIADLRKILMAFYCGIPSWKNFREGNMEPKMIAIHVIRAESYMLGAHKVHTISQMIKARIYGMLKVWASERVVLGEDSIPITPPFLAYARITSSGTGQVVMLNVFISLLPV